MISGAPQGRSRHWKEPSTDGGSEWPGPPARRARQGRPGQARGRSAAQTLPSTVLPPPPPCSPTASPKRPPRPPPHEAQHSAQPENAGRTRGGDHPRGPSSAQTGTPVWKRPVPDPQAQLGRDGHVATMLPSASLTSRCSAGGPRQPQGDSDPGPDEQTELEAGRSVPPPPQG